MKIDLVNVRAFEISDVQDSDRLDPIQVFLQDIGPCSGRIVVECYGQAWSAYFENIGDKGIHSFLSGVDSHYLASAMRCNGPNMTVAGEKRHEAYLLRIVDVVLRVLKDPRISSQVGLSSLTRETGWSRTYFEPYELGSGGAPGDVICSDPESTTFATLEDAVEEGEDVLEERGESTEFCVVRTTHEIVRRLESL